MLDDAVRTASEPDGSGPDRPEPRAAPNAREVTAPADDAWDRCSPPYDLRPSQTEALERLDALRAGGGTSAYVALPPGTGKTVLGLEAVRRLRRRALVLVPSTVVQGQWRRTWADFGGADAAVTVLTLQDLSAWDRGSDDQDVEDGTGAALAERRRAAVRGVEGADLLSLLHPQGSRLVEAARAQGPWTLVVDECGHVLETWGSLLPALARALGDGTPVLGLSATPARELSEKARGVHDELFGDDDVEVALPTAVARREIAPFTELVHLTRPTPEEDAALAGDRARFAELRDELLRARAGSLPFADWLWRRLHDRTHLRGPDGTGTGGSRSWRQRERDEPALSRAGLRAVTSGLVALPPGAVLLEEHRAPLDAQDWAVLLGAYATEHLRGSTAAEDARLLTAVGHVLPALGWSLGLRGLRAASSPVDRVCALSAGKAAAARRVLAEELSLRRRDLRALVVCDVDGRAATASSRSRRDAGPYAAGSAGAVFAALASSELAGELRPVLCTGRTIALRREDLADFRAFAPHRLADRLVAQPFAGQRSLVALTAGEGWTAAVWAPLVTSWLAAGGSAAVVGTRGLLGEGWDCPSLNTVVDLTSAAGTASATSVQGRALRRAPERPDEVVHVWTVVCVADDHPRGGVDHSRAVRAHERHVGLTAAGELEFGPGHLDDELSPYAAPSPAVRDAVNARAVDRAGQRTRAREAWEAAGEHGRELTALRVRAERPLGLPAGLVPAGLLTVSRTLGSPAPAPLPRTPRRLRLWPLPVGGAVVASATGTLAESALVGAGGGLATGLVLGGAVAGGRYAAQSRALRRAPQDAQQAVLHQLARAVADALHEAGEIGDGASAVGARTRPDGQVELVLAAPPESSRSFALCLQELLLPLGEPRWLVSRLVVPPPEGAAGARRLARARAVGRPVDAGVTWHAVPRRLARSKAHVDAFDAAWQRHLGAGRLVLASDAEGRSLVELLHGEDPFGLTTRVRTVWR